MNNDSNQKDTRLNIRADWQQKNLIIEAAKLTNKSISNFILDIACQKAQEVLIEKTRFELPEKQWKEFCKALDAKPKRIDSLKKLLNEPGVFD